MEYFDVVDKNRTPLNYKKTREEKLDENEYNTGAELWIINNNKILMTKRSLTKSHPGKWEVPGGCSQTKENTLSTIIREIKEEIGIFIKSEDICLVGTILYKKQFVDIYKTEKTIHLANTNLQKEEVIDISFVDKKDFYEKLNNNEIVPSVSNRFNIFKNNLNINW